MSHTFVSEDEVWLHDSIRLCQPVTEGAPHPMAAVSGESQILVYANPAFYQLLGSNAEEVIGKPLNAFLPEKDACPASLERVYRSGAPESHTKEHSSDEAPLFWSYLMWPIRRKERTVGVMMQVTESGHFHEKTLAINEALMLGSLRQHELVEAAHRLNALLQKEICERKQTEQALREARVQLTSLTGQLEGQVHERTQELSTTNSQLEAFVYTIAHDLRAPLRAMQGFAALLVEEAGATLSETSKSYAERISRSAQFMDLLLGDLLAFSRLSQQRVELSVVSLEAVVQGILSRSQREIQESNACVESVGPWPFVLAHEVTLSQVLFNLVSNALKFTIPGVRCKVRLRAESQGEFIRCWVEDNGIGIAPEHQSQVFRPFTRLDGEKFAGTGIGLAIVQKGVERMGGRVGVESSLGNGCRFWFALKKAP